MANFRRIDAKALMVDGTEYGPVRIVHADKVRWERAARANDWSTEDNPMTFNAFLTWSALDRTKAVTMSYEEFTANLETAETSEAEASENPTK